MKQYKFRPLTLTGRGKPRMATCDHLCKMPGCWKYINAGENMVRWGSFELHVACAAAWCDARGIEHIYEGVSA